MKVGESLRVGDFFYLTFDSILEDSRLRFKFHDNFIDIEQYRVIGNGFTLITEGLKVKSLVRNGKSSFKVGIDAYDEFCVSRLGSVLEHGNDFTNVDEKAIEEKDELVERYRNELAWFYQ